MKLPKFIKTSLPQLNQASEKANYFFELLLET